MKFKPSLLLLVLFALVNCKQVENKRKTNRFEIKLKGSWTNCSREYEDGTMMMGNVCLKLIFQQDSLGVAVDAMGGKHKFFWAMRSDTLDFRNAPGKDYKNYETGLYKVVELPKKKLEEIVLYHIARKTKYYLAR